MSEKFPSPQAMPLVERDTAFVDTYANQLRMGATLSDFTLIFSVTEERGLGQTVVREKVAVHMPPTVAKMLLVQMQAAIESYEKAVASIPVPHDFQAHVDTIRTQLSEGFGRIAPLKKTVK